MAGINPAQVYVPTPDQSTTTGAVAVAPTSTSAPTDARTALGAGWATGGYVGDAGISMSINRSMQPVKDWSQASVRKILTDFDGVWNRCDCTIFENGQGLGLDKDVPYEWHTTSKTGLANPARMLRDKGECASEVIYVTRSYLTRHGVGRLEEEVRKKDINAAMHDRTNVPNEFQGSLRYGYLQDAEQRQRIEEDWATVAGLPNFEKSIAVTHCNEFPELRSASRYFSDNPYSLRERA